MRRAWNLFVQFIKVAGALVGLVVAAPFWLFTAGVAVIRFGLGLIVILFVFGLVWESGLIQRLWQGEESVRATTSRAGGEARRDRARARQEALDGRAAPGGGGQRPAAIRQSKEDRRREAAAAKRARARYQVEQRRMLEERVLGQRREKGNI